MSITNVSEHESKISQLYEEDEELVQGAEEERAEVTTADEIESQEESAKWDTTETDTEAREQPYERPHSRLGNRGPDNFAAASHRGRSLSVSSKFSDSSSEDEGDEEDDNGASAPADDNSNEPEVNQEQRKSLRKLWLLKLSNHTLDEDDQPSNLPQMPDVHTGWKECIPKIRSKLNPNIETEQLVVSIPDDQSDRSAAPENGVLLPRSARLRRFSESYLRQKRSRLNDENIAARVKGEAILQDPLYTSDEELHDTIKSAFDEAAATRKENDYLKTDVATLEENVFEVVTESDALKDEVNYVKKRLEQWKASYYKLDKAFTQEQEECLHEKTVAAELRQQQSLDVALVSFRSGEQWPVETRQAVASRIVNHVSRKSPSIPTLEEEEVISLLDANRDALSLEKWIQERGHAYQVDMLDLSREILLSGEACNLGLVNFYLTGSEAFGDENTPAALKDFLGAFGMILKEWNESLRVLQQKVHDAEEKRLSIPRKHPSPPSDAVQGGEQDHAASLSASKDTRTATHRHLLDQSTNHSNEVLLASPPRDQNETLVAEHKQLKQESQTQQAQTPVTEPLSDSSETLEQDIEQRLALA